MSSGGSEVKSSLGIWSDVPVRDYAFWRVNTVATESFITSELVEAVAEFDELRKDWADLSGCENRLEAQLLLAVRELSPTEAKRVRTSIRRAKRLDSEVEEPTELQLGESLAALRSIYRTRAELLVRIAAFSHHCEAAAPERLQKLIGAALSDHEFLKAVALSSAHFSQRFAECRQRGDLDWEVSSQDAATLVKYITRAAFKISPFSRFVYVAEGSLDFEETPGVAGIPSDKLKAVVTPRYAASNFINEPLFWIAKLNRNCFGLFDLVLNDSVLDRGKECIYLYNFSRRDEVITIRCNAALSSILAAYQRRTAYSWSDLVRFIRATTEMEEESANLLVWRLLLNDLISLKIDFHQHLLNSDSWLDSFQTSALKITMGLPSLSEMIINLFGVLRESRSGLERGDYRDRPSIVENAKQAYMAYFVSAERAMEHLLQQIPRQYQPALPRLRPIVPELLIYENCIGPVPSHARATNGLPDAMRGIGALIADCSQMARSSGSFKAPHLGFADYVIGETGCCSFTELYARYSLAIAEPATDEALRQKQLGACEMWREAKAAFNQDNSRFHAAMDYYVANRSTFVDDAVAITTIGGGRTILPVDIYGRYSVTLQPVAHEGIPKFVVNSFWPGAARLISRFLDVLSPQAHESMLAPCRDDVMEAEITEGSFLNVNNYPPVYPYEISVPGAFPRTSDDRRISIRDIEVWRNATSVELRHRKYRKRIIPHRVSLEGAKSDYSGISSLLDAFGPWGLRLEMLFHAVDKRYGAEHVELCGVVQPAIYVNDAVIIRRKKYLIHGPKLRQRLGCNDVGKFVRALQRWVIECGLPNAVYVSAQAESADPKKGRMNLDRKPQLVVFPDFASCVMLRRILLRARNGLIFSEAVPFDLSSTKPYYEHLLEVDLHRSSNAVGTDADSIL